MGSKKKDFHNQNEIEKLYQKFTKKCNMAKNHFKGVQNGSKSVLTGVLGGYFYWKVVLKFWFGHQKYHFWYPQNILAVLVNFGRFHGQGDISIEKWS